MTAYFPNGFLGILKGEELNAAITTAHGATGPTGPTGATGPTGPQDLPGTITANGSVATVLGSLGPTGSHTTVQGWAAVVINATTYYIPLF